MLDKVLTFFADEINAYLQARTGDNDEIIVLSPIVDETGKYASDNDTVAINIINIEEETALKDQLPEYAFKSGQHVVLEPSLKLNLFIMFAANFRFYDQALKYISHILTYFQGHRLFTPTQYPALSDDDGVIERLAVELQKLNYDQLNQIWAYIGGKQLPSVIYKVRLVSVQDQAQTDVQPPISIIQTQSRGL